jgi:hypothetical protein
MIMSFAVLKCDLPSNNSPFHGQISPNAAAMNGNNPLSFNRSISIDVDERWKRSATGPTQLLILDGNHLRPIDLVHCERGQCILQVSDQHLRVNI